MSDDRKQPERKPEPPPEPAKAKRRITREELEALGIRRGRLRQGGIVITGARMPKREPEPDE